MQIGLLHINMYKLPPRIRRRSPNKKTQINKKMRILLFRAGFRTTMNEQMIALKATSKGSSQTLCCPRTRSICCCGCCHFAVTALLPRAHRTPLCRVPALVFRTIVWPHVKSLSFLCCSRGGTAFCGLLLKVFAICRWRSCEAAGTRRWPSACPAPWNSRGQGLSKLVQK